MQQRKVNLREWTNPANWSHPRFGVYFSKRDTRLWVPKRGAGAGWTLNLARPAAAWLLVALILVPPLAIWAVRRRRH